MPAGVSGPPFGLSHIELSWNRTMSIASPIPIDERGDPLMAFDYLYRDAGNFKIRG
jgi:hypothetical protein